jgi:histone-lysine N-methyltransferase SETMAR
MLTVVWNPHGFHVIKVLPRGCKWTSQYHIDNILPEICALHIAGDRRKIVIHADNASPHVSTRVKQYMEERGLRTAPYPPYSPDLASSDFFLFGYVKRALQGSEFQTVEELQACIDTNGEYVDEELF